MQGPFTRSNFDPQIFNAARDGSYQDIRHFDVDLSTARSFAAGTYLDVPVSADSIYIDANPLDGNAVLYLQPRGDNKVEVPLYVSPGFILNDQPFTRLRIENAAQSGKKIRVVYGVGSRFQPGSVAQVQVNNLDLNSASLNTLTRPLLPGANWKDTSTMVANTPVTVFAPAANVNGAIIHSADAQDITTVAFTQTFVAKASAPTGYTDGEIVAMSKYWPVTGNNVQNLTLQTPTRIDAGLGLYFLSSQNGSAGYIRTCRYTLL